MRWLGALLLSLWLTVAAQAQWAHVQTIVGTDGTATAATTVAINITVTGGNTIVGLVSYSASLTLSSVKDDLGNTFTVDKAVTDTADNQAGSIFHFSNETGGARTVTATFSGSADFRRIMVAEYSGLLNASPVDGTPNGTFQNAVGTGANVLNSGNTTTTAAGDLIWGPSFSGTAQTFTAGTSPNAFTQRGVGTGTDNVPMQAQDFRQAAAATIAATAGTNVSGPAVTFVIALKAAATAACPSLALLGVGC